MKVSIYYDHSATIPEKEMEEFLKELKAIATNAQSTQCRSCGQDTGDDSAMCDNCLSK